MNPKSRPLAPGYAAEVTRSDEARWREVLDDFDDGNCTRPGRMTRSGGERVVCVTVS